MGTVDPHSIWGCARVCVGLVSARCNGKAGSSAVGTEKKVKRPGGRRRWSWWEGQ